MGKKVEAKLIDNLASFKFVLGFFVSASSPILVSRVGGLLLRVARFRRGNLAHRSTADARESFFGTVI